MKILESIFKAVYGALTGGLLVQQFYIWFLLPVFTQLPSINYIQAIGLGYFLYLFNQIKLIDAVFTKQNEDDDMIKYGSYILPWVILGMGFVAHLVLSYFGG